MARLLAVTFMRWDCALSAELEMLKMLNMVMAAYSGCRAVFSPWMRLFIRVRLTW
ncbi:hypothetical protein D3C78_1878940 [compost metagenome]